MAIRADSYSSTTEVKVLTRHLLDGETVFNSTTRPTLAQVEKLIDRASGVLNVALYGAGFTPPIVNTTAKLACDDWVTDQVVRAVELTAPASSEYGVVEEERPRVFAGLAGRAHKFVEAQSRAFKYMNVTCGHALGEGLYFTGQVAVADRADPDDDSLAQPRFHAEMFEGDTETT